MLRAPSRLSQAQQPLGNDGGLGQSPVAQRAGARHHTWQRFLTLTRLVELEGFSPQLLQQRPCLCAHLTCRERWG